MSRLPPNHARVPVWLLILLWLWVAISLFLSLARVWRVAGGALPFVLVLTGYLGVYLTTPRDLDWHLGSSLDRLLIQLWPLALLGLGAVATPPEPADTSEA